jgi:uncharacterized membrane protein
MKKSIGLIGIFICGLIFSLQSQTIVETSNYLNNSDKNKAVSFNDLEGIFYASEDPNLTITFEEMYDYAVYFDANNTELLSNTDVFLKDLQRGDHTITLKKVNAAGDAEEISKSFKVKASRPWFSNDATVFGLLMIVLFFVFKTAKSERSYFKKFYKVVPALLLCYFIPAGLNSFGIISSEESNLYFIASRYLLPASLILLCLSIDIPAIKRLGSKAIIMFFAATAGIVVGGPLALYVVSLFAPEVLNGEIWRGLSTVAGSWIGGGANQTAMKEIYGASDQMFSAMIVVDVFVANIFMSVLLFGTGYNKKLNRFFKADDSAIESLKTKMEEFQMSVSKIASFNDLIYMLGITFCCVGIAHLGADYIGPWVTEILNGMENQTAARLMVSFGNGFFWLVVLSTIFGVGLSFTKYREFEGVGASKIGSVFLYVLVATIGMKMDIMELIANWGVFKFLLSIGLIWIMVHALFLFVVAKIIKAPFFYVAVGSQANVGGAASAPIVASAFSPSLAPVGVLLAVLGYAVGTFGAIVCTLMMQALSV